MTDPKNSKKRWPAGAAWVLYDHDDEPDEFVSFSVSLVGRMYAAEFTLRSSQGVEYPAFAERVRTASPLAAELIEIARHR